MAFKRRIEKLLIFCFIVAVFLPLLLSNKVGGQVSSVEKRTLAKFPSFFNQDGSVTLSGTRSGLENWINDNAAFRLPMQKLNADLTFNLFHSSPSSKVKIGKNGWYYYTGDNNLEIASGTYPMTQDTLEKIKEAQVAIQQVLKKKGITYVLVLTPSKVSVYPENLVGDFQVRQTVIDEVADYLTKNTTIPVINLKNDLLKAKQKQTVYFKTDTHWNQVGAYVGYSAIINRLNDLGIIDSKPTDITTYPSTHKGEFSVMMGDADLLPAEPFQATKIISPKAERLESGDLYNEIDSLDQTNYVYKPFYLYHNPSVQNKKLLIYGDSFFEKWNVDQLFAQNFSDLTYIWSYCIRNNVVNAVKPNIVILEQTERYITNLANDPDPYLLNEPLQNPQAQIVSTTTPTQIERGKMYDIDITVKNIGTESWSEKQMIRLCIFQDGKDWGYRVKLPDGVEVKPGEQYTFTLHDFRDPPNNTTYLEYQMAQEGIQYFGQKQRVDITVK
ncbi:alginate O-acetyltransferase AlgX-related protein [Caproiciproducens galactitolivorans]|uniref:alginate O-acetyltransferase AlgX-related protein n=1 Tax=Caproiciproducens galactitolivorans TaxID=642589 RepID=UPI00240A4637|nr:hypothetical protein [Caproiciproducens galactitolivorans]